MEVACQDHGYEDSGLRKDLAMSVKNINQFHGATREQLCVLSTQHLLNILESARGRCPRHVDGEPLTEDELAWNEAQRELYTVVKEMLAARPHYTATAKRIPKQEKKAMRY